MDYDKMFENEIKRYTETTSGKRVSYNVPKLSMNKKSLTDSKEGTKFGIEVGRQTEKIKKEIKNLYKLLMANKTHFNQDVIIKATEIFNGLENHVTEQIDNIIETVE